MPGFPADPGRRLQTSERPAIRALVIPVTGQNAEILKIHVAAVGLAGNYDRKLKAVTFQTGFYYIRKQGLLPVFHKRNSPEAFIRPRDYLAFIRL